jgi:hypothetical protein
MICMGMKKLRTRIPAGLVLAIALAMPTMKAEDLPESAAVRPTGAQESTPVQAPSPRRWAFGSEIDALPFAMKGYYGSVFVGRNGWKLRAVAARSTTPSFMVTDGFKDKRTDACALLADRFIGARREKLEGLWVGGGGEYWRSRIRTDASPVYTDYHNVMLTAGSGYVWKLSRHFYLNPWTAGHFAAAGKRDIVVSGKSYKQPVITPEGSIKIGITF